MKKVVINSFFLMALVVLFIGFASAVVYDNPNLPRLVQEGVAGVGITFNNATGGVNSSAYWGSYLWTDYNMPTIKTFAYNMTEGISSSGMDYTNIAMTNKSNDFGGNNITASKFNSTVATGTQPYECTSTTMNTNLNADLWDGNQFATYLNQPLLTSSSPTFVSVKTAIGGGFGMDDQGSIYYTYHKQFYGTPYNTIDRNIYWAIGNADRIISLLGNLNIQGNPTINQSLTQTSNIHIENVTANNITLKNLYVSETIGNATASFTLNELNKTLGTNYTNICMLNQSNNFGNNNVSIKYFNVSEMNYYGGNVSFFTKSTTGTGSNNGDVVKICNPGEARCGELYIDQYGRLVISIPNDDLFFTATGSVTIKDLTFDATTMGSASDVLDWQADNNKNGQGRFRFYTSTTQTVDIQNQSSSFYGNLSVTWNVTINGLAGTGNAYACVNSAGKLYRSAVACV